jgi:hypothetical protein
MSFLKAWAMWSRETILRKVKVVHTLHKTICVNFVLYKVDTHFVISNEVRNLRSLSLFAVNCLQRFLCAVFDFIASKLICRQWNAHKIGVKI